MDLKWLEDFLSLAETRSFSRSAALRNVTQPAFSRRIKALEAWVGSDLVDRSVYPTTLTPAGKAFRDIAAELLQQLNDSRAILRGRADLPANAVQFAVSHTLALTHLPELLGRIESRFEPVVASIIATNVHDGVLALNEGGCDLLLCYHHPRIPLLLDEERYPHIMLGRDRMHPYAACGDNGEPLFRLPGSTGQPLPYLGYTPGSFLGRAVDMILQQATAQPALRVRHRADMAEALKALIIGGGGIGWLPERAAARELDAGRLAPAGGADWSIDLEVRLYRARDNPKALVDRLCRALDNRSRDAVPAG